jgi:hypothetical protein
MAILLLYRLAEACGFYLRAVDYAGKVRILCGHYSTRCKGRRVHNDNFARLLSLKCRIRGWRKYEMVYCFKHYCK